MNKVGIFIGSEQKGFFAALSYYFEKMYGYKVTIFARDENVVSLLNKILPSDNNIDIINLSTISCNISVNSIFEEAKRIEKEYAIKLSLILSSDRALGQGYLSNVQKIPDIIRASWPYGRKIEDIVSIFLQKESVLRDLDLVIQLQPNKIVTSICKKHKISFFSLTQIKFGDRVFWSDDNYFTGSKYIKRLKKYLISNEPLPSIKYCIDKAGDKINKSASYSYKVAIKSTTEILINDFKKFVLRSNKKNSYHYFGWVPSVFRRVYNYKYVKKVSKTPDDLLSFNIVFFTLHLEPEVALQYLSPEFSNSMEAIIWISKSLPVNYILVVKEQVGSYGVRSRWYCKQLVKMPNVVLARPDISSWDWIKASKIVSTITGTVGQEAIHFNKPVISYGRHQIINYLPTVYYVSNLKETNEAVDRIINTPPKEHVFQRSKNAFSNAQIDSSINLPRFKYTYKSDEFEGKMAVKALKNLFIEYHYVLNSNEFSKQHTKK